MSKTTLTPILIGFGAVLAFVAVLNLAIQPLPNSKSAKVNHNRNTASATSLANGADQNVNDTAPANTNQGTAEPRFFITEWGVWMAAPTGVTYKYSLIQNDSIASFSTNALTSYQDCGADQAAIGAISRYQTAPTEGPLSFQTPITIGEWKFYYTHPQATCSDSQAVQKLETEGIDALQKSFLTLQANTTANATTDWKTYVDSKRGYSFSHPKNWTVVNCADAAGSGTAAVQVNCDSEFLGGYFVTAIHAATGVDGWVETDKASLINPVSTAVTIDGYSGKRIHGTIKDEIEILAGRYSDNVYVNVNGTVYRISNDEGKQSKEFETFLASVDWK